MRYPTYLEVGPGGWTLAYVFRLPGLFVHARSAAGALAALPQALEREWSRLERHGREWPYAGESIEVEEVERERVTSDVRRGVSSALFRYELRPTTDADVALALDRFKLAYLDVSEGFGYAGFGDVRPDIAALPERLCRIVSCLGKPVPAPSEGDLRQDLAVARERVVDRLRNLIPGDRERHVVLSGEAWTLRKVLRRLVFEVRFAAVSLERAKPKARTLP